MKELENYDEWARKEEEFHLGQQRQRSAIRLVEGRERPVDVLAQNILLFGCGGGAGGGGGGGSKYREKYSALEELGTLEANLEEPYALLSDLKAAPELEELLVAVDAFRRLEREAADAKDDEGRGGEGGGGGGGGGDDGVESRAKMLPPPPSTALVDGSRDRRCEEEWGDNHDGAAVAR
ncbi:hypothetical protein ACHAW5_002271 [Stephanodiscus triporus]|uniref:Splicing factor cactin central domain-containing protein n=1 Tax=Stephanodiscus triporus TaxID=2934178 RepID=A0ABD3N4M2_9STRA